MSTSINDVTSSEDRFFEEGESEVVPRWKRLVQDRQGHPDLYISGDEVAENLMSRALRMIGVDRVGYVRQPKQIRLFIKMKWYNFLFMFLLSWWVSLKMYYHWKRHEFSESSDMPINIDVVSLTCGIYPFVTCAWGDYHHESSRTYTWKHGEARTEGEVIELCNVQSSRDREFKKLECQKADQDPDSQGDCETTEKPRLRSRKIEEGELGSVEGEPLWEV